MASSLGYTNGFNIGALMEKGIQLTGCGQAPVQKYWEEILNDYIIPGKFDPTLYVFTKFVSYTSFILTYRSSIITHRVPFDDMVLLYDTFAKRQAGVEKVFVETKFSSAPSPGCPKLTRVSDWKP